LHTFWFATLSGLPAELVQLAIPPLQIMAFFPALTVAIGYQRAILIHAGVTLPVILATVTEALGIFSILALLVLYSTLPGVTAAALAYLLGRCLALLYLYWPCAAVQRRSASTF
jgi:Na+-driven multidrug efflux pump